MDKVIVDQSRASMIEPQIIQASGNTLEHMKTYLQTYMPKSKREIYFTLYIDA